MRIYLSDLTDISGTCQPSQLSQLKKVRIFLSDITDLGGTCHLNPIMPLQYFMSLKNACFLSDITDLSDLRGKPRAGLGRVSLTPFFKWHEIFKWHKRV